MVSISKFGDSAIKFTFDDSDHYLMGDGEITVPVNGLILVLDESDMATFKKIDGDPFISFNIANSNFSSKSDLETFYKDNMVGSTSVTPEDVEDMISEATSGLAESSAVTEEISEAVSGKADSSAVTASINSAVSGKMDTSVFNTYSASTDARISEDEEVTSAALNALDDALDDKADTTAVTASIAAAVSGKQDTLIAGSGITIDSANTISCTVEGGGKAIVAGRGIAITTGATADTVSFDLPISAGTRYNSLIIGESTNISSSNRSIATGFKTKAEQSNAFAQGYKTEAGQENSHAEGYETKAYGTYSHSEGKSTSAVTAGSHAEGYYTKTSNSYEHASGEYNSTTSGASTSAQTLFSVGNGTAENARHNAFEIRKNGDIYITSGGTDIKLQDNLGGGVPESAFTAYTASTEARLAEDEEVTAAALNTLNTATAANTTALGGLKLVSLTQAQYDALVTKDSSTLYIVTSSN